MLTNEDHVELDGLDDYDRSLASEMDAKPIYAGPFQSEGEESGDKEAKPIETEV